MASSQYQQISTFRCHSKEILLTTRLSALRYQPHRLRPTRSYSTMRLHYKRPWFLQRTLHRLHRHDHQKQELAEAWLLDLEDRIGKYIFANHRNSSFLSASCLVRTIVYCIHSNGDFEDCFCGFYHEMIVIRGRGIELHTKYHHFVAYLL